MFGNPRYGLKKALGLTTTPIFVHFFAVSARLRRESAYFKCLSA